MMRTPPNQCPIKLMASTIGPGQVVTWLNHWSLQNANWDALSKMDIIGFDGTLLQMTLASKKHRVGRTSGDLVLPHVIDALPEGSTLALIGAAPGIAQQAADRLERPGLKIVPFNGYEDLARLRADSSELRDLNPDLIILGLGAGLQDEVALEFHEQLPEACICTTGGWLDQLAHSEQYFPAWVHRARLGWVWRIAHEPRRLIGRYTMDAIEFRRRANELIARLADLGGEFNTIGLDRRALRKTEVLQPTARPEAAAFDSAAQEKTESLDPTA